jgi:tetratricopeptide (TPR) repeat protein
VTAETLLLAAFLAFGTSRPDDGHGAADRLKDREQLLAQLYELQRRVRAGELPTEEEMKPGRVTRERILAGLDVRRAKRLGVDPKSIRDLLVPGFAQELDLLLMRQEAHELAPGEDPSPLLVLMLEVEQRMFSAADRKRQRAGIKSPIDSGPLSRKLEAPAPAAGGEAGSAGAAAPNAAPNAAPIAIDVAARGADPKAVGRALYRAGRFSDALKAWERVALDDPQADQELLYTHADALFRAGRQDEALKEWERLATRHPDSSYGQQAAFARDMARVVIAVRAARGDDEKPVESASNGGAGAPEAAKPATDAKPAPHDSKPDGKSDAKDGARKPGGGGAP